MHAPLQRRTLPPAPIQAKRADAAHPLAAQLNARASVRQLQRQAAQLNARGGPALRQAQVADPVVQGMWPAVIGLAGLATVGALGYRWWTGGSKAKAEAARKRGAAVKKQLLTAHRQGVVDRLLDETEAVARRRDVKVTNKKSEVSAATGADEGGYVANVNPEHPINKRTTELLGKDPHLRDAARLHELTHVSAWEGYGGKNRTEPNPFNMVDNHSQVEFTALTKKVAALEAIREHDPYLEKRPIGEQTYFKERLNYMAKFPSFEFDSVLNELVYYCHLKNISANSPFSKALVKLAAEQQALRAPGARRGRRGK